MKLLPILNVANQEHARQNFTVENYVCPISYANDGFSLMIDKPGNVIREPLHKTRTLCKIAEGGFASVCSVEEFIFKREKTKIPLKKLNEILRCKITWKGFENEGKRQGSL